MNPTDPAELLAKLKPLHTPDAIGLWPPAIGWWICLGLGIAVLFFIKWLITFIKNYNLYKKQALFSLTLINKELSEQAYGDALAQLILRTLKATPKGQALLAQGPQKIKHCLLQTMPDKTAEWFIAGRYQPLNANEINKNELATAVENWIKKHRL